MATVVSTLAPRSTAPQPPSITRKEIRTQFRKDIAGKEVQTAETSSHSWVANQFGHVCLGIILGSSLSFFVFGRGGAPVVDWLNLPVSWTLQFPWDNVFGSLAATIGVAAWELRAYLKEAKEAEGGFRLDRKLLRANAITATAYMVLGVAFAFTLLHFAFGPYDRLLGVHVLIWCTVCFVVLAFIGVVIAQPWLRQKIVWQKAALPYLFRLADAKPVTTGDANRLQALIDISPPPDSSARHFVIGGPTGSGRTEIGAGIGTEFAFKNAAVRYLSLATLLEFAARFETDFSDDLGPENISYWPWTRAQVVIIDDIGPVLTGDVQNRLDQFVGILQTQLGPVQAALQQRHTVWVLGDPHGDGASVVDNRLLDKYAGVIGDYCNHAGNARQEAVVIQLEALQAQKSPKVPRAQVRYV